MPIRIHYTERDLQRKVKAIGGTWDPGKKLWYAPEEYIRRIGLTKRIVRDRQGHAADDPGSRHGQGHPEKSLAAAQAQGLRRFQDASALGHEGIARQQIRIRIECEGHGEHHAAAGTDGRKAGEAEMLARKGLQRPGKVEQADHHEAGHMAGKASGSIKAQLKKRRPGNSHTAVCQAKVTPIKAAPTPTPNTRNSVCAMYSGSTVLFRWRQISVSGEP